MFKDECLESITVTSDIKEEKYVRDQFSQTKSIKINSAACQAIDRIDVDIQTDFEHELPQKTRMKIDTSKALSNFLLSVYPVISEQLVANIRSRAFDGYDVDWNDDDENDTTSCLHTLNNKASPDQKITSVCWNSTGSVIAASSGSYEHESWCVHQSFIYLWNIDRSNINASIPDKIIDSDTCLMSISFHPKQPALLTGGDFSGKIYIWDMSQDDNTLVAYSGKELISHQEPVTKITWLNSVSLRKHELVSVGCDGRILLWEFNQLRKELKIMKKFLLQSDNIPRSLRLGMTRSDIKLGIMCVSISSHKKDVLFIGTENGAVLMCLTESPTRPSNSDADFLSPPIQAFEGHLGTVNAIDASPHFEDIFLTCGSDMSVHIYNTHQVKPLIILEPVSEYIFSTQWSRSRPTVFFVATGHILVFDLSSNGISPVSQINTADKKKLSIHSLACNAYQHNVLATGDSNGFIKVWSLPQKFTQEKAGETNFFNNIESSDL